MAYIAAITADGGIPLTIRKTAGLPKLHMTAMLSMYGIETFMVKERCELRVTRTDTATVLWKNSPDSGMMLVLICDGDRGGMAGDDFLARFLDQLDAAFMMLIGRAAITGSSDTILEKLVQGCNPLIDLMLNSYRSSLSVGPVLGVVDKALASPDSLLQGCLDSFVYGATATCGVLIVEGCVLEATKGWHDLGSDDRQLLSLLAKTGQGSFETTVHLARSSRSASARWVCVDLMDGVTACLLCGEVPSLNDIQTSLVERTWVEAREALTAAIANFPHNVPAALGTLPTGLVGLLIVNTRAQWATFSDVARAPNSADAQNGVERGPARDPDESKMAVCTWYKSNVTSAMAEDLARVVEPDTLLVDCSLREGYCCGPINKCYIAGIKTARANYHVATLFDASIPTFSLRGMTMQAFEAAEPFL